MSTSMKSWQIRLLALVVFSILVLLTVSFCAPHIQQDLQSKTTKALQENGMHWAKVNLDGRDMTLGGIAPTEALQHQAESIARDVWGTNQIDNQITLAEAINPYTMKINADGSQVNIDGWAADDNTRQAILRRATSAFGEGNVVSTLEFGAGQPSGWSNAVGHMLDSLSTLERGQATFTDTDIHISGRGTNPELAQAFENSMASYQDAGYVVSAHISAPAPPPPELTCQERFNVLMVQDSIQFGANASVIDQNSYSLLNELSDVARECSRTGILITGHTDATGRDKANMELSLKRAEAVATYLTEHGIPADRLQASGAGESNPVADNATAKGRAKNRRIEFTVKGI